MKKIILSLFAISALMMLVSCASILGKSNYNMTISSNPVGSSLSITDKKGKEIFKGNTPANVTLKSSGSYFSKAEYQLKFSLKGYDDKIVPVTAKLNGWYFGNILLGGLVGMLIVDPLTGAMYKIENTTINETLTKNSTAQVSELRIRDIHSLSKEETSRLVKIAHF